MQSVNELGWPLLRVRLVFRTGAVKGRKLKAGGVDADESDAYFLTVSGYLEPTTLYYGTLGEGEAKPLKHAQASARRQPARESDCGPGNV